MKNKLTSSAIIYAVGSIINLVVYLKQGTTASVFASLVLAILFAWEFSREKRCQ